MNVEEKVATLEALLARVQNNAAKPRIPRPAEAAPPNGGAHLAAPEPAVAMPKAPAAKPAEKIAPTRAEAPPAQDSIDAQLAKLLDVKVEKPVEAKIEKPVETKIEKPVETKADLLDVWAEALQDEVPKVQPASPIAAPKVDDGTPKPAPIAARSVTPVAAKPVAVRPVVPAARPSAPRPTFGSKAEVTPSPAPTAAKVVEKIEPAITPPKPVEKVAPIVAAPKPAEKITPIVAAPTPPEKVEKIDGIKAAEDEIRFDFDLAPPKKPEAKAAEKPVETAVAAKPVKVPPLPVKPLEADLAVEDDLVTHDDETMLMHGSIPEPEPRAIADETTTDEETVVSLPKADEIAARADDDLSDDEPTTDAASTGEIDEPTHVFQGRPSRPEAESPAPSKVDGEGVSASKIDDLKVVVSPSVRAAIPVAPATSTTEETARAIKITEAVPPPQPSDSGEATAPSRRYSKPESEELESLPMNGGKRSSTLMLGLVAAALIGAGVFVGLRNGWFEGSSTTSVPTAPTASGPAPAASTAAITTASAAPIVPTTSAATPEPTTSAGVAPTTSASAAPTASAAPSVTASAAPSAAPTPTAAPVGDGTNLPPNRGYVIINSTKPANVFLTGNFAGATGAKLEVECGAKFLRLAAPWPAGTERPASPDWTSEGRSISVVCRSTTTVAFEAAR